MENNRKKKLQSILTNQIGNVVMVSPSPLMIWLAPVVKTVHEAGLIFDFTVTKVMTNPLGGLHGGITAAIMDDMVGATIICLGQPTFYVTVNNTIDYLAPAKLGDIITGKTTIISQGRQIIHVQFELWNLSKSRLLAKGSSNLMKTAIPMSENGTLAEPE